MVPDIQKAGQGRAGQGRAEQGSDPMLYTSHKNILWNNDKCKESPACGRYNALLCPVL